MITAFDLSDNTASGPRAVLNLFRHNRIRIEHLYCDSVALKSVVYERRRGRVNWSTVDRFISGGRRQLLCREGMALPSSRGYRRFESCELDLRLCENAALYLLNNIDAPHLNVVLLDDNGDHTGMCTYLSDATDRVSIVTAKPRLYLTEADRLMEEKGAVINVTKSDTPLKTADLIIAPASLSRDVDCADDAVILSAFAPTVSQNAPVIRGYWFDLPQKYRDVKPDYLEDMYFASAMYVLSGAHELGSYVFRRCCDGVSVHTRKSLLGLLKKRISHT